MKLSLAVSALAFALAALAAPAGAANLRVTKFEAPALNQDGTASVEAGAHPYELINRFKLNESEAPEGGTGPAENLKDLTFELPPGIVGNAAAFPRCPRSQLETIEECPKDTQVGTATNELQFLSPGPSTFPVPIFNMEPPPGVAAQFTFKVILSTATINFHVRSGGDYGVNAVIRNLNEAAPIYGSTVRIWGVPGDPGHDAARGGPYPKAAPYLPLLSNPTSCGAPQLNTMAAVSWQLPGETTFAKPAISPAMSGCNEVGFEPSIEAKPSTDVGDSPSGLEFHLHLPQTLQENVPATAHLRESKVVLPPGLTVNPSSANGLGACTTGQIGYEGGSAEKQLFRFNPGVASSFTVSSGGQTTAPIPAEAGLPAVKAALETLPGLAGNIGLTGAPGGWLVTFGGSLAGTDVASLTGSSDDAATQKLEVTGDGGSFNLEFGGESSEATFESGFEAGANSFILIANQNRLPRAGEVIEGPGIAPGTKITQVINFGGERISISNSTTEAVSGGHFTTGLSFSAGAEEVETALQALPGLGAGNVFVQAAGSSGSTRTFQISFGGTLIGTEPATIVATSSLSGEDAGAVVSAVPAEPQPLEVTTTAAAGAPHFSEAPAACPDASKLGTVQIDSPDVLDHPLKGSVYLATPHQNPFDSLLAMYIAVNDPRSGVVLKLPGLIEADPRSGQLTATFSETPQLPFEDLQLSFFKGAGAPLKTGIACGKYDVRTDMVPWSAPEAATAHPADSFTIDQGCSASEAAAPATRGFEAGTADPTAGAYSPFNLKLTRPDGSQQLTGIETTLPKGLLAKLAGVPYCPDAALAAAAAKSGTAEQASPSCPAASQVGTVSVGAGAGPTPFNAPGAAYLAGPYKGAPLSLAVVTPAVAGPFDLGTVVVRNALFVDPTTAQVRAVSDPFPSILQGIPLDIRSVTLKLERPRFTKNPTSCAPFAVTGAVAALSGQSAPISSPFQVGDCNKLGFKPKLSLQFKGATKRAGNPAVTAVLTQPEGQSGIAGVQVLLPKSAFIDQAHIGNPCTRVQFNANACPPKSVLGTAVAYTPLLEKPLEGPVYFRSNGGERELPDIVADLSGQLHVTLVGFIDSVKKKGTESSRLRTRFQNVPDAPVSKFVLKLKGGQRGLVQNSANLCKKPQKASVQMDGQNGRTNDFEQKIAVKCGKSKGSKQHKKRH